MADDKRNYMNHKIVIVERENITVNGVTEVLSFDEEGIMCASDLGLIIIRGNNLHIGRLDLDARVLTAEGAVDAVEYADGPVGGGGIFKRLFR